jgi:hypothetical protein
MDIKKLSLGERILTAAGLFLLLDMLILPWHRVTIGLAGIARVTQSRSAIESPNAFLGLLAFLLVAALVAQVILAEFTSVKLPEIPMSWGRADLLAAGAVAALLALKLVVETSFLGVGAWLALAAAGVLVYGGVLRDQELNEATPV